MLLATWNDRRLLLLSRLPIWHWRVYTRSWACTRCLSVAKGNYGLTNKWDGSKKESNFKARPSTHKPPGFWPGTTLAIFGDIAIKCSKGKHFILLSIFLHIYFYNFGLILKVIGLPQPWKVSIDLQKQLSL